LQQERGDRSTVESNNRRRQDQSAVCIQRHWRRHHNTAHSTPADFSDSFVSSLQHHFPNIASKYSVTTTSMVFPHSTTVEPDKIIRRIVPTQSNSMSLFKELSDEGYTLEEGFCLDNDSEDGLSKTPVKSKRDREEFNTPVAAHRPDSDSHYAIEKELREDFDNPYYTDSDSESDQGEVVTPRANQTAYIFDSGYEGFDSKGSSPYTKEEEDESSAESDSDSFVNREMYTRPAAVQMCFVEEPVEDTSTDSVTGWNAVSFSKSDSHLPSSPPKTEHKRTASYGGEQLTAAQLKEGWRNSAHLMTLEQLNNWVTLMETTIARTNAELVTHLDSREGYMEEQDALLQKIFAIKSIGPKVPDTRPPRPSPVPPLSRRLSSMFRTFT